MAEETEDFGVNNRGVLFRLLSLKALFFHCDVNMTLCIVFRDDVSNAHSLSHSKRNQRKDYLEFGKRLMTTPEQSPNLHFFLHVV